MRSKALADLDVLFARIDEDPDLCPPCKTELTFEQETGETLGYLGFGPCTCPPFPQS